MVVKLDYYVLYLAQGRTCNMCKIDQNYVNLYALRYS